MDYMDSNKIGQRIENKLIHALGRTISEATNDEIYKAAAECIRDDIMISWADSRKRVQEQGVKKLYYMSAEFLMGRAFSNNLINQGLYEAYREAFWEMGLDFDKITDEENDAGLGNGGLGRLAACFLDSLSTMELPVLGCGIRYEYGMFRQKIVDGTQIEMEDDWLRDGNVWEIERPELSVEVHFNGTIQENWTENGLKIEHKDYNTVITVPYDVPIIDTRLRHQQLFVCGVLEASGGSIFIRLMKESMIKRWQTRHLQKQSRKSYIRQMIICRVKCCV